MSEQVISVEEIVRQARTAADAGHPVYSNPHASESDKATHWRGAYYMRLKEIELEATV